MKKKGEQKRLTIVVSMVVCLLLLVTGLYLYPNKEPLHIPYGLFSGFSYTVYSDHVELEEYKWNFKTVRIPDSLWGRPVTVIGECCFMEKDLNKVVLPEHLQFIGDCSFKDCLGLKEVSGGEKVEIIGIGAFYHCDSLHKFEPGVNVKEIRAGAFYACYDLSTFSFGDQLDCIDSKAFTHTKLEELPVDIQVSYVGEAAFWGTPWMEKQTEDFVVWSDVLMEYNGSDAIVHVPEGVRGITGGLRSLSPEEKEEWVYVKEMYLPDSMEYIEAYAFYGRENLRLYIPASVKKIGIYWSTDVIYPIGEDTMTIITTAGSAAEAYAKEMGLACEIVEGW